MKQIAVFTGSRADYGLLQNLIKLIQTSKIYKLKLVASCMHFSEVFGNTYQEIQKDGLVIDHKIEMLLSGSSALSRIKSMGIGLISFADALNDNKTDLAIILGDRFEALSAAIACMMNNIPIAHIHGGELTFGAQDDAIRHAITKLSSIHFVSHHTYAKRVIQMGEQPKRVIVCGALGIDNIVKIKKISKKEIGKKIGFNFKKKNLLLTYHTETKSSTSLNVNNLKKVFKALKSFKDLGVIITAPNADSGGEDLIKVIEEETSFNKNYLFIKSLGYMKYIQLMMQVDAMIGNSSSGVLEAPFLKLPSINIGNRQFGRIMPGSVINSSQNIKEIERAIHFCLKATNISFKDFDIYGHGKSSEIIFNTLKETNFSDLKNKNFYDLQL